MTDPGATLLPGDLRLERDGHVALLTLCRPPNNFLDVALVSGLVEALLALDEDPACRAVVLAAEGKHFCAGADFSRRLDGAGAARDAGTGRSVYQEACRLTLTRKPVVAAVQGGAIGAGLGLAAIADFRVTCAEARFSANFTRLGIHPGFGLTATLPRLVGAQKAAMLFYTGRRIGGEEAVAIGLADLLVPQAELRAAALSLAQEIAGSAPLAIASTRVTLRQGMAEAFAAAAAREEAEQDRLRQTADFREGVRATAERRAPEFRGA
jgi:enoyl-CoA hydratase/carnithine racemase